MPRIVPLPFEIAKKEINKWTYEAIANDDIMNANKFKVSLQHYDINCTENIGCIGIVSKNTFQGVVLMEKFNEKVCIWDISCKDYSSGSILVKALVKTADREIVFMNTVDDRWKIARSFYL